MWATNRMGEAITRPESAEPQGDAASAAIFEALAERHIYGSYKLAIAILANPQAAQDAVHDAFVKAWERWSSLRDPTRFDAWFRRIVVNTCRDRLREAKHRDAASIADHAYLVAPEAQADVDDRVYVEQALMRLKPDDQILFALRYYVDLELADIADLLEVPTGTVKSRLNAAHSRLRSILEPSEGNAR